MTGTAAACDAAASAMHLVDELNHRVINEYSEAICELSIVARSSSRETRVAVERAASRLKVHAEAHRALAPPPAEVSVNLADYLGRLCASLSNALLAHREVRIVLSSDEVWIDGDRAWRIALILAELVRNACRHGIAGRGGAVALRIEQGPGVIRCLVADNGCGSSESKPGRGRRLIQSLAVELGGSVEWMFSAGGTAVRLEVPRLDDTID